jgi:SAM-dependent methyltransferase
MVEAEFQAMLAAEDDHWWYRGRRLVVAAALDRVDLGPAPRILDVGCGSGRMLDELSNRGAVAGLDVRPDAVLAARARGHADTRLAPAEETGHADGAFDLVTAFDVIEHTPDDRRTLRELRRITRPHGRLLATVPAHPHLWSQHDVVNMHYRRYTARSFVAAARDAGWLVDRTTYFFSHLLAPAALVRWTEHLGRHHDGHSDLEQGSGALVSRALLNVSAAEAALIGRGGRVPAGLSLLALLEAPGVRSLQAAPPAHGDGRTRARPSRRTRPKTVPRVAAMSPATRGGPPSA